MRGQFVGYRGANGVPEDSQVETFAAVRLFVDSWRWAGVPFYIRAGKKLPVTSSEVFVELKRPPRSVFGEHVDAGSPNHLRFRVSPNVETGLGVRDKVPGEPMVGKNVELLTVDPETQAMQPYERLIDDAMRGDLTLFSREDTVEAEWAVVDKVLDNATPVHLYEPGTWGPREMNRLKDGPWHEPKLR